MTRKKSPPVPKVTWHEMSVTDLTTFAELKDWMRSHVKDGAICPCCELPAKVYRRKLNSSMAYVLMLMIGEYDMNGGAFMHVPSMINRKRLKPKVSASLRGDYAKLRYCTGGSSKRSDRQRRRRETRSTRSDRATGDPRTSGSALLKVRRMSHPTPSSTASDACVSTKRS